MGQRWAGPGGIPGASDRLAQVGLSVVQFGKALGGLQRSAVTDYSPRCCVSASVKWGVCVLYGTVFVKGVHVKPWLLKDMLDVLLSTMYICTVNDIYIYIGISQADQAGLEKAPRWAKICSKSFQTKTCLDFVILSLCVSLSVCLSVCLSLSVSLCDSLCLSLSVSLSLCLSV